MREVLESIKHIVELIAKIPFLWIEKNILNPFKEIMK